MRLGYNSNGLQNHRLDDALRLLADCGYEAVALTPDVGHLDPFRATAREVGDLAALLHKLRLEPLIETGARFLLDPRHKHEPTLMARDAEARQRRLDFYDRCAAIGADLGARVLSFWTGVDRDGGSDRQAYLAEAVAAACELVRRRGLQPSLEPEPGHAVETTAQYRSLAAALGPLAPALTLDVGHLYAVWEGEPAAVIAAAGPHLAQVHLEDMRLGVHEHLPPGTGVVDFTAVLTALQRAGYQGPVCWELARSSHAAPGLVAECARLWGRIRASLAD